jgi:hypothetical protein
MWKTLSHIWEETTQIRKSLSRFWKTSTQMWKTIFQMWKSLSQIREGTNQIWKSLSHKWKSLSPIRKMLIYWEIARDWKPDLGHLHGLDLLPQRGKSPRDERGAIAGGISGGVRVVRGGAGQGVFGGKIVGPGGAGLRRVKAS